MEHTALDLLRWVELHWPFLNPAPNDMLFRSKVIDPADHWWNTIWPGTSDIADTADDSQVLSIDPSLDSPGTGINRWSGSAATWVISFFSESNVLYCTVAAYQRTWNSCTYNKRIASWDNLILWQAYPLDSIYIPKSKPKDTANIRPWVSYAEALGLSRHGQIHNHLILFYQNKLSNPML